MRRNLCKVSLRFQLHTLIFIMIAGLILVTLFYYWSFNHLTLQSTNEYFTTISDLLYSRVEMIDYQFSRTVEAISTNKALQRYVAAGEDEEGEISAYVENLFLDAIQPSGRSMAYNGIRGIALVNQPGHFHDIKNEGNPAVLCQEKTSKTEWWYMAASEKQHQRAIYNHPPQNLSMQSLCLQSTCLN